MTRPLRIVAVSGGLQHPSRTGALARHLAGELAARRPASVQVLHLGDLATGLAASLERALLPPAVEAALAAIESADVLVVATPVYRASYSGLFKHLFDFVAQDALVDVPVLLAATGGSDRHALVLETALRPLFTFFQALTLPIGVYAGPGDFDGERVVSVALRARIALAVERALPHLQARPGARMAA